MNKQGENGIGWCDYTWNPVGGCRHGCRWQMPDGTITKCYAEAVAEGLASSAYPDGFQEHYWHPERLMEPFKVEGMSRIFLDSMSDLMGHWVPPEQTREVLKVAGAAAWHTFQLLTKNAPRLLNFIDEFPTNLWVGVSMPPTFFAGRSLLSEEQKERYLGNALTVLSRVRAHGIVTWMSCEPLSFDVARMLGQWEWRNEPLPLDWIVIGAASSGKTYYQPEPSWVADLLSMTDDIPVYMKSNLDWNPRREEFPQPDFDSVYV